MIRPLRSRHRWLISLVAAVVLVVFFAAMAVRPERPIQAGLDAPAPAAGELHPPQSHGEDTP